MSRLIVGFWTACEVRRPESRNAADAAIASRATAGSSVRELIAHPPFGRPRGSVAAPSITPRVKLSSGGSLLREDARAVAADAVAGQVLVIVREGDWASLQPATPASAAGDAKVTASHWLWPSL